jgi:WD40 repeat protein
VVLLWDIADPAHPRLLAPIRTGSTSGPVDSVAFSPAGHTLASGDYNGTIRLWNVTDPAHPHPFGPILTGSIVASVAFSPGGHTLVSSGRGSIRLWNVTDPAYPSPIGQPSPTGAPPNRWRSAPQGICWPAVPPTAQSGSGISPIPGR